MTYSLPKEGLMPQFPTSRHIAVLVSLLVVAVSCVLYSGAAAEGSEATVQGAVTDSSGAAIPGATITVHLKDCACRDCPDPKKCDCCPQSLSVTTSASGEYRVQLQAGSYSVTAEVAGFASRSAEITLRKSEVRKLSFRMETGGVE
jgi:hypothetical protein